MSIESMNRDSVTVELDGATAAALDSLVQSDKMTVWERLQYEDDDPDAQNDEMIRVLEGLLTRECKAAQEDDGSGNGSSFLTDDEVSVIQTIIEDKRG